MQIEVQPREQQCHGDLYAQLIHRSRGPESDYQSRCDQNPSRRDDDDLTVLQVLRRTEKGRVFSRYWPVERRIRGVGTSHGESLPVLTMSAHCSLVEPPIPRPPPALLP